MATASSHASGAGGSGHTLRVEVQVPLGISNGIPSRESKPVSANHCPNICPNVHVALDRLVGAPEADGPRVRLTGEEAIWHTAPCRVERTRCAPGRMVRGASGFASLALLRSGPFQVT